MGEYGNPIFIDCHVCGKPIKVMLEEYNFKIYNIDSDSLHECFVKEWYPNE